MISLYEIIGFFFAMLYLKFRIVTSKELKFTPLEIILIIIFLPFSIIAIPIWLCYRIAKYDKK